MSKTPTPRTDAVVHNIAELGVFARNLERELAAANHQITLLIAGSKKDERQLRRLKDALQEAYEEGYADCSFEEDCNYQASRAKRIAEGKE